MYLPPTFRSTNGSGQLGDSGTLRPMLTCCLPHALSTCVPRVPYHGLRSANGSGQLGYSDTVSRGSVPGSMGDDLPPVDLGSGLVGKGCDEGLGRGDRFSAGKGRTEGSAWVLPAVDMWSGPVGWVGWGLTE